jgi:hypothetical protein
MAVPDADSVPEQTSSPRTRECAVAWVRMPLSSVISTAKLDRPSLRESRFQILVKAASNGRKLRAAAGTKDPAWARIVASPIDFIRVDLPLAFTP